MKTIIFFCITITMTVTISAQQKSTILQGAWQTVSIQEIDRDSVIWKIPGDISGNEMKIWSKNHFLFVGRYKEDSLFTDDYGGGIYKLDGNHYEETLLYHSDPKTVGSTLKMLLESKQDTLIQIYPFDENWQIKSKHWVLKYIRIE
jgi:hypothetical protein